MKRDLAVLLLLLLVACGDDGARSPGQSTEVTILFQSGPDSLDPSAARSQRARFILGRLIGCGLMERDVEGRLVPVLAETAPETLKDGFRFRIRREARWPDGQALLAEDFRRGFDLVKSARAGGLLGACWARVDDVAVEDDRVFRIKTREAGLVVLESLALDLLPVPAGWRPGHELSVGPGPFELTDHGSDASHLRRRQDWWGDTIPDLAGRFAVDRLQLRYEADQARTLLLLESGAIDVAAIDPERAERLRSKGFEIRSWDSGSFSFVGFDCGSGPTSDPRLRRILADSAPRDLAESRPLELRPAYLLTGEGGSSRSMAALPRALDAADFVDHDGDGRREGPEGAIELRLVAASGSIPWLDSFLIQWREILARLGIVLEVERLDLKAMLGRLDSRDFDLFVLVWRRESEFDAFRALLHSSQTKSGGRNFSGLESPALDRAIEAIEASATVGDCASRRRALADLVAREAPIAPLFLHAVCVALRPEGFELPFGPRGPWWPGLARR